MVTDAYPPMRTSCAVQMYDLGQAFIEEGHQVTIITPESTLKESIQITLKNGVRLVQVKAFQTKDINYIFRTLAEFINPFLIWHKLKNRPEFINTKYDGIIWYSPTIFWGPLIRRLKQQYKVKTYLILRDIFPDWVLDLGLINKGIIYKFLKAVERFQYQQADIIGVQSPNNLKYFKERNHRINADIEVLWNWLGKVGQATSPIDLNKTILAGRKILIYAGNMGVAQGTQKLIGIALELRESTDIGFVFIGRGSEVYKLRKLAFDNRLTNVLFLDEISPLQILPLIKQCAAGLLMLDQRHRSHNIPGKFISYIACHLKIFGFVNPGNDLIDIVNKNNIGYLVSNGDIKLLKKNITHHLNVDQYSDNNVEIYNRILNDRFLPKEAIRKISIALKKDIANL